VQKKRIDPGKEEKTKRNGANVVEVFMKGESVLERGHNTR